jgi:hypothetical protein
VEPAESGTVLLLLLNLFVLLVAYYVLKTVREPLILTGGGAEMKSYAASFQAATLIGFVPAYAWMSTRVERSRLVVAMGLFFVATVEVVYLASLSRLRYLPPRTLQREEAAMAEKAVVHRPGEGQAFWMLGGLGYGVEIQAPQRG